MTDSPTARSHDVDSPRGVRATPLVLLLAAGLMMGLTATSRAAVWDAAVTGGWSRPTGDLSQSVREGYHLGVSLSTPVDPHNALGIDASYHALPEKLRHTTVFGFPIAFRERASVLEGIAYVRIFVTSAHATVSPYLKAGAGVAEFMADGTLTTPLTTVPSSDSHLWSAFAAGAGVSMRIGKRHSLRVEGLFHEIEAGKVPADMFVLSLSWWGSAGP